MPCLKQQFVSPCSNCDYCCDIHLQGHLSKELKASDGIVYLTRTKCRGHFAVWKCPEGDFCLLSLLSALPKPGESVVSMPLLIYSKHLSLPEMQCVIYRARTVITWSKHHHTD